jgi:hypothetical protein
MSVNELGDDALRPKDSSAAPIESQMAVKQDVNHDEELKRLSLENARLDREIKTLDIKLKNLEIKNKPGFWKGVFTNAAFLAAVITIFVTAGTATVSFVIAKLQRELDLEKSLVQGALDRDKHEDDLITKILSLPVSSLKDRCDTISQLSYYLGSGVFKTRQRQDVMETRLNNLRSIQPPC